MKTYKLDSFHSIIYTTLLSFLPSIVNSNPVTLKFFINTNFNDFTTRFNQSATINDDHSTPFLRAQRLVWLELCRNLNSITDSGFKYNDGVPIPPPVVLQMTPLITTTTTTTTTMNPNNPKPFTDKFGLCWQTNEKATCTPSYPGNGITIDLTVGTLTEYVIVADISFPAQDSMDNETLMNQIRWFNLNQWLNINLKWFPFNPTNCSAGYYENTTLWLIDDPVYVSDHSQIMLGAAVYSFLLFFVAFGFVLYHVRALRKTERYIEAHRFDFDDDDIEIG